jgi:hypothetical protein
MADTSRDHLRKKNWCLLAVLGGIFALIYATTVMRIDAAHTQLRAAQATQAKPAEEASSAEGSGTTP